VWNAGGIYRNYTDKFDSCELEGTGLLDLDREELQPPTASVAAF